LPFNSPLKRDNKGSKLLHNPAKSSKRFVKACESVLIRLISP